MSRIRYAVTFTVVVLAGLSQTRGQVCGISGSKLNSSCSEVIDKHSLEFEILYAFEKRFPGWDVNGTLTPLNSDRRQATIGSDLFIRMTFGVFRNTEIGATVDKEADEASLSIKWMPFHQEKTSLAVAGGVKFDFAEAQYYESTERGPLPSVIAAAVLVSQEITPSVSVDLNAGYSISVAGELLPPHGCLDLCFDCGCFLFDGKLQVVMGAGYRYGFSEEEHERFSLLTLYPGITVTTGSDFEILVAIPQDLYGINHPKSRSVICALTLTLR